MAYDLQNYSVSFTRIPLSLTISAQVTDPVTGQVRGTVSASFPTDLSLLSDQTARDLFEAVVRRILHQKVVQAGWM